MRLNLSRLGPRRKAAVAVGAVAAAVAGVAAVAVTAPAFAATGCNVTYLANNWQESSGSGGFTANISITNLGDPLTSWTLKFTLPSGQTLSQGWSANWTSSGSAITGTSLSYNGNLGTGASTGVGFNGRWSGSYSSPTSFTLNGVTCNGGGPSSSASSNSSSGRSSSSSSSGRSSSSSSRSSSSRSSSSASQCTTNCPTHVDNPYAGAKGYVNPEWKAHATAEAGGSRIANTSTAVWLDRIATIEGTSTSMGLRAHLDAALSQVSGGVPVVIQFVVYDLPNRDCAALASNGELTVANDGLNKYKSQFIDPIAAIMADPKYAPLRIVNVVEDDSLPNLVTNLGIAACAEANSSGAYVQGVQYALNKLHAIPNVYNYLDIGHHAWLGWSSNFGPAATLLADVARGTTAGYASVDGFIDNTANYGALVEPNFTISTSFNGTSIRQSKWVDWNDYVDELSFTQGFRQRLITAGFPNTLGMLIDTSRNGWGGASRPSGAPTSATSVDDFVNKARIDRRVHAGNWCNQSGAGIGERPQASPATGIDAYVWIKPPGESDGASKAVPNDQGKGFDRMCDPTYGGNSLNGNNPTGALPDSPLAGAWFSAQFQQLMQNAYPPLS